MRRGGSVALASIDLEPLERMLERTPRKKDGNTL